MKRINVVMVKNGYAPAREVASALGCSATRVHAMVSSREVEGVLEGGVLYVSLESLLRHYRACAPMLAATRQLQAELRARHGKSA